MKTCSYCGRDNRDTHARCEGCGTEFEVSEPAPRQKRRFASVEQRQQENLRRVAAKQPPRRCACGVTMHPVGARGTFPVGCVETISAAVMYECGACRHKVEIPAASMFVTYGLFSLIFLFCGLQFVDWKGRAGLGESALFFLIFASPGMLTTWLMFRGWRRRRSYPAVKPDASAAHRGR